VQRSSGENLCKGKWRWGEYKILKWLKQIETNELGKERERNQTISFEISREG